MEKLLSALPAWMALIGGLLVAAGGALDGGWPPGSHRLRRIASRLTLPAKTTLVGGLIAALGGFGLIHQQDRATENLMATVTGGRTFLYVMARPESTGSADVRLFAEGGDPLYDVEVEIRDVDRWAELAKAATDQGQIGPDVPMVVFYELTAPAIRKIHVGNLPGCASALLSPPLDLSGADEHRYDATIIARNGTIHEDIFYRRIGEVWHWAFRVLRGRQIVKLYADEELMANGKYPWPEDGLERALSKWNGRECRKP